MARILVVDDDEDIREALCVALSGEGHEVRCALDGREALALLRGEPRFQAIVLDLNMPVMGARDFVTEMRKDPAIDPEHPPVILMSVAESVAADAAALGLCASLRKPFSTTELLGMLRHCGVPGA